MRALILFSIAVTEFFLPLAAGASASGEAADLPNRFQHSLAQCVEGRTGCEQVEPLYESVKGLDTWTRADAFNLTWFNVWRGHWQEAQAIAQSPKAPVDLHERVFPTVVARGKEGAPPPAAYAFDFARRGLRPTDLLGSASSDRPLLLIKFSPRCHFCEAAAQALSRAADRDWVARCAIWGSTVDGGFDLRDHIEWRDSYPRFTQTVVARWSAYGLSDVLETPVFYILKQERLVKELTGWPHDGSQLDALRQAMREADGANACQVPPAPKRAFTPPPSPRSPPAHVLPSAR